MIIDVTNPPTLARRRATAFFEDVTGRLQRVGAAEGVKHMVALSIVGVDRVPGFGYYEAKLRHEQVALAGPIPATIVRATQFHEFPAEILRATRRGPVALMLAMRSQPVAARTVGEYLLDTAATFAKRTGGAVFEIAGPEAVSLVPLARRYLRHRGRRVVVIPLPLPGAAGKALRTGAVLPSVGVRTAGPTFDQWLTSEDAGPPDL